MKLQHVNCIDLHVNVTSSNVFLFYLDLGQRCLEIQRQESLELRVLDGKFYKGSEEGSQTGRRVSFAKKMLY
jgi:hypothetical protein